MHGVVFHKLKSFAETSYQSDSWQNWLEAGGIDPYTIYMPGLTYPDGELVTIISGACTHESRDMLDFLNEFGIFLAPELMSMVRVIIKPEWKTLDLIEHTEQAIHSMVRVEIKGAKPPQIAATRDDKHKATITYTSVRRMCPLMIGIVRGVARHYKEEVTINEDQCMLHGAESCVVKVEVTGEAAANGK